MTPATEVSVVPLPAREVRRRLANLRRETTPYHDEVERRVDIVGRLGSWVGYVDLLTRLYGFYEPFEAELSCVVTHWGLPFDAEARQKSPLIARDLRAMGFSPTAIDGLPRLTRIPRPTSPSAALGCLYVTEGATLGGQVIARHVEHGLGLGPRSGASFFRGYGAHTGSRWRTFCSVLASECGSTVAEQAIVAGAIDTFLAYDRWLVQARAS